MTEGVTDQLLYDGHGGPEASRLINNYLFRYIEKLAAERGGLSKDVIAKAFDATETDFLHLVNESSLDRLQTVSVGSCCLVSVISNDTLFVPNLGDYRAVLAQQASGGGRMGNSSAVVAERLSTDHKVGVEEVRKEVTALYPVDSHIAVYTHDVWRIKGIIQVLRSIGGVYLKKPEYNKKPSVLALCIPFPFKKSCVVSRAINYNLQA